MFINISIIQSRIILSNEILYLKNTIYIIIGLSYFFLNFLFISLKLFLIVLLILPLHLYA